MKSVRNPIVPGSNVTNHCLASVQSAAFFRFFALQDDDSGRQQKLTHDPRRIWSFESRRCHGTKLKVSAMTAPILALATFTITAPVAQLASIVIAIFRLRRNSLDDVPRQELPPVSLVRPLCGLDNYAADTLRSTFDLDCPNYEILFCVATASDPVVPLVKTLIAEHGSANARLLIGDDRVSGNPKLNNVVKGWRAARHDWIVLADSNVLMPRDYIRQLFASWREDTGAVASP